MIVIEFAGNPGTGKSTICSRVLEKFRAEGADAESIFRNELEFSAIKRKMFAMSYRSASCNKELKKKAKEFLKDYPGALPRRWSLEILKTCYKLDRIGGAKDKMVFMEEGPTQFLTSIVHMSELGENATDLIREINRTIYNSDVLLFDIVVSEEETVKRIRERNRQTERFVSDDADEVGKMLSVKRRNLDAVEQQLSYKGFYQIENDDLETAVNEVYRAIQDFRKEKCK